MPTRQIESGHWFEMDQSWKSRMTKAKGVQCEITLLTADI